MDPPRAPTQLVSVVHTPALRPSAQPSAKNVASRTPAATPFTKYFSQSQLALALVIQKSKPEGFTTAEYYQGLRKRIKTGRPVSSVDHRYVDTSEFWKDQYTSIHLEKKVLEDRILRLEEENRLLVQGDPDPGSLDYGVRQILGIASDDSRISPPTIEDGHLRLSRYVFRLAQQRNLVEKAVNNPEHAAQIQSLSTSCNQAIRFLFYAVSDCCAPLALLTTTSADAQTAKLLQLVMNQIIFNFRSCFQALNVLCKTILGRTKKTEIVHHMITFFKESLELLQAFSTRQGQDEASQWNKRLRQQQPEITSREYIANKYLSSALSSILQTMGWNISQPGHSDLLEGILFLILNHTGRLLSNAVFQEHVAEADNPGQISAIANQRFSESIRLESRYILQILHSALGGSGRQDIIAQLVSAKKHDDTSYENGLRSMIASSHQKNLLHKAKLIIQSTLVKSAFGGVDMETLRLPAPPEELTLYPIETPTAVEKYGPEWFVESVWCLIGWEMVL